MASRSLSSIAGPKPLLAEQESSPVGVVNLTFQFGAGPLTTLEPSGLLRRVAVSWNQREGAWAACALQGRLRAGPKAGTALPQSFLREQGLLCPGQSITLQKFCPHSSLPACLACACTGEVPFPSPWHPRLRWDSQKISWMGWVFQYDGIFWPSLLRGTFILPDLPRQHSLCSHWDSFLPDWGRGAGHTTAVHSGAVFSPLEQKSPQVVVADGAMLGGAQPGQAAAWVTCGLQANQELPPLPPCQAAEPSPHCTGALKTES